jgi:hypothetical protein
MIMGSPLWKRGVRGDFVEIFNSIGVEFNFFYLKDPGLPFL